MDNGRWKKEGYILLHCYTNLLFFLALHRIIDTEYLFMVHGSLPSFCFIFCAPLYLSQLRCLSQETLIATNTETPATLMSEEGRIRSNTVLALDQIPNSRYSSKTLTTSQHNTTFSLDLEYEFVFVCGLFRQRSRRWHSQEQLEFSWLHIWLASGSLLLLN